MGQGSAPAPSAHDRQVNGSTTRLKTNYEARFTALSARRVLRSSTVSRTSGAHRLLSGVHCRTSCLLQTLPACEALPMTDSTSPEFHDTRPDGPDITRESEESAGPYKFRPAESTSVASDSPQTPGHFALNGSQSTTPAVPAPASNSPTSPPTSTNPPPVPHTLPDAQAPRGHVRFVPAPAQRPPILGAGPKTPPVPPNPNTPTTPAPESPPTAPGAPVPPWPGEESIPGTDPAVPINPSITPLTSPRPLDPAQPRSAPGPTQAPADPGDGPSGPDPLTPPLSSALPRRDSDAHAARQERSAYWSLPPL